MKTNVHEKTALKAISDILDSEFVFGFDVYLAPHRTELAISTDKEDAIYTTVTAERMISFLEKLKIESPDFAGDIDELIKQLNGDIDD